MLQNSQIRSAACASLKGKWIYAAMFLFVYGVVSIIISWTINALLGSISNTGASMAAGILLMPMVWSYTIAFLRNGRGATDSFNVKNLFYGYTNGVRVSRIIETQILQNLLLFFWTLLLIVPGFVKMCSYAMTPYILEDDPNIRGNKAIERSMAMMNGHKLSYFVMSLLFGLYVFIAAVLSYAVGYLCTSSTTAASIVVAPLMFIFALWFVPYMQASYAKFYEEVKAEYEQYAK